ncbi:M20/M25/M40 family metallo-hydrolase [Planctomicrobium sp. SH668]|uniref:M20/M25/M40 family metallo-hydrolase n=1 Tax=Planctomicrobium sp. SH668 TaxID=3448126 RepID=UPI003F5BF628
MVSISDQELQQRLFQHVDYLAGVIGSRHLKKAGSIPATRGLIEKILEEAGCRFEHEEYEASGHKVANIIVERLGTTRPEQVLIVGAHYDTVPTTPGADDNASAVAVLLELTKELVGNDFDRTVRFVFFPCEEPPHYDLGEMGSQLNAKRCRIQDEKIVGMLCLEMLGYYTDEPNSQRLPPGIPKWLEWAFPKKGNFLASVSNLESMWLLMKFRLGFKRACRFPLFSIPLPEKISDIRRSDHASYWDQQFPAIMLTDTSYLRNANYHRETDTPETLDYPRMVQVTRGISGAIRFLAGERKQRAGKSENVEPPL